MQQHHHHHDDPAAAAAEVEDADIDYAHAGREGPLVFQCATCRHNLGDSLTLITIRKDLRAVVIATVTEAVVLSPTLATVRDPGPDLGSTYVELSCGPCESQVGRVYKTTCAELDEVREGYSLDLERVTVYQLGSTRRHDTLPPKPPSLQGSRDGDDAESSYTGRVSPSSPRRHDLPPPGPAMGPPQPHHQQQQPPYHPVPVTPQHSGSYTGSRPPAHMRTPSVAPSLRGSVTPGPGLGGSGEMRKMQILLMSMGERLVSVEKLLQQSQGSQGSGNGEGSEGSGTSQNGGIAAVAPRRPNAAPQAAARSTGTNGSTIRRNDMPPPAPVTPLVNRAGPGASRRAGPATGGSDHPSTARQEVAPQSAAQPSRMAALTSRPQHQQNHTYPQQQQQQQHHRPPGSMMPPPPSVKSSPAMSSKQSTTPSRVHGPNPPGTVTTIKVSPGSRPEENLRLSHHSPGTSRNKVVGNHAGAAGAAASGGNTSSSSSIPRRNDDDELDALRSRRAEGGVASTSSASGQRRSATTGENRSNETNRRQVPMDTSFDGLDGDVEVDESIRGANRMAVEDGTDEDFDGDGGVDDDDDDDDDELAATRAVQGAPTQSQQNKRSSGTFASTKAAGRSLVTAALQAQRKGSKKRKSAPS